MSTKLGVTENFVSSLYLLILTKDLIIFSQRAQHKPATQMQRPPQDSKKHPGDHAHQRSSDLKRPTDGGGPGGKIPRMDRTYSGSSSHSGGRPSGSGDSYDPRRSSSFSHSDRTGTSSKERSRDGYVFILQAPGCSNVGLRYPSDKSLSGG